MEGHKRRKGFYEEKANQSVGVRDNGAFSYVCVGACRGNKRSGGGK